MKLKNISFNKVFLLGVLGIVLTTGYLLRDKHKISDNSNVSSISQTENDTKSLRQRRIDSIIGNAKIPYCSGVIYDEDGSKIISFYEENMVRSPDDGKTNKFVGGFEEFRGGDYDFKTPDVLEWSGKGESIPIFIGRKLFEDQSFQYLTSEDIRHIVCAHEATHCKQHAEGFPYITSNELINGLRDGEIREMSAYYAFEYDAYCDDLPRAINGEFKVSERYLNEKKKMFIQTGHGLNLAHKTASSLEQKLIEGALEKDADIPELRDISAKY